MVVPDTLRDVMNSAVHEPATVKIDAHGRSVLSQSLHRSAFAMRAENGDWELSIGRLKVQVSSSNLFMS